MKNFSFVLFVLFLLCPVCVTLGKTLPDQFNNKDVRGWIILSDDMNAAIQTIKAAKEYDINQLQLSHEIIHDLREIKTEKVCAQVNELVNLAHSEGINEVLLWDHSLYDIDYYPERFRTGPGGTIDLDNTEFWEWLKDDYRQMLDRVSEADGLVLTFIETGAYAERQFSKKMKSSEEKLAAVVNAISDVLIGERKKKLYIRTFAYSVIVEFDLGNEYSGQGVVANTWPEHVMKRWNSYIHCPNVTGYVARTDRYGNTSIVNTANAIQLYALKRMTEDPKISVDRVYNEFIESEYGNTALLPIKKAFQKAFDIVTSVFYTLGTNLTDHSSLNYENNKWGYSRHVSGRWIDPPVVRVEHDVNRTFHYWKDIVNHIAPVQFKSWFSPSFVEVKEVFDRRWMDVGEKMDSLYYRYIVTEKRYGVRLAAEALSEIEKTKPVLDSVAYNELQQLFYRTYLTASLHEAVCTAYYGIRIYTGDKKSYPKMLKEDILSALERITLTVNEMEQMRGSYPIGQYNWLNDARTALWYRDKIKRMLYE